MGLLDDLKMGLGLKERDKSYYERTAKTLANTQGEARAAQYRQSSGYGKPGRRGLLSGFGGGSSGGSGSQSDGDRPFLAKLLGYRDMEDMFDRGGPYASGGLYQGAGGYSLLANLAHAASGQEFGERTPYEKVQAKAVIKSTNGAVPEATRNAIASLRPMLRPDNLNVPGPAMAGHNMPTPMPADPIMAGHSMPVPPAPQPPAPVAQAATGLTIPSPGSAPGVLEMGTPSMGGATDIASMRNELTNAGIDTTYMPNDLIPDFYNTYLSVNR